MSVLHLTHPACARHLTGAGHPERPERLPAIQRAIGESGLADLVETSEFPPVERDLLLSVHSAAYVDGLEAMAQRGGGWLDQDTRVSADSAVAAAHAAGAAAHAAEVLCAGGAARAFLAVRPPGHHALPEQGMGFCLFNNAAVAAAAARRLGRKRVMIVDWDVHHGNGTQAVFWRDPGVLFVSLHQEYWYPGTGALGDVGEDLGEGFTVNLPLPADTGDGGYEEAFTEVVLPLGSVYNPDFLVVSAGYDAHFADPLGGMVVTARGFGRLARLLDEAASASGAPLLVTLEGGYDLAALGASCVATLEALVGRAAWGIPDEEPPPEAPSAAIRPRLRAARRQLLNYWRI
ncbi:MAG: histone deacetylase [Armatimonadetes bacterium]|nr:histone deacetylase [Armatimonadota bacterium]